jgi:hypothetical protein
MAYGCAVNSPMLTTSWWDECPRSLSVRASGRSTSPLMVVQIWRLRSPVPSALTATMARTSAAAASPGRTTMADERIEQIRTDEKELEEVAVPPYFIPPSNYSPPSKCMTCKHRIFFHGVIGGFRWSHLTGRADHDVTIRETGYWDTMSGETVYGNPLIHPEWAVKGTSPRAAPTRWRPSHFGSASPSGPNTSSGSGLGPLGPREPPATSTGG